ncbi:MAG: DUF885 domain-containing protein [Candidatus Acidiferrum sp.]|jgi:uncharacterized protein (DUF885 family)
MAGAFIALVVIPVAHGTTSLPDAYALHLLPSPPPLDSLPSLSLNSIQDRLSAQNLLFKQQFAADMKSSPETATAYGDYRYNAQLDHLSLAASAEDNSTDRDFLAKLEAIPTDGFPEQDRISHDLLLHVLTQRIADFELKTYEMPLSQMEGVHNDLADLPNSVPLDTVQHYDDYLARLHQIPRAFEETIEVLRQGMKDGLMPVRFLLEQVPAQCAGTIAENPFLEPTKKFPSAIPDADQKRLTAAITAAVNEEVLPAYRRFAEFVAKEYAPHGRTSLALSSLPDGARRYQNAIRKQTTTSMSPAEIRALGLKEVARITQQMNDLAHKAGYPDLQSYRAALAASPKYIPQSADQLVNDFSYYIAQMQPRLPELFGVLPKTPVTVEAVPPSQPGNATHYVPGTPDGSRPGRVVVATSNFAHRIMIDDETVAYHEGVPGHHMQISIQQQLTGLPEFRLHLINNAFAEGWAVYAEALGKEIGFFQDPASDFGRLSRELLRAVRLVIDPGIHSEGWTRDQAVAYFRASGAADEPTIQAEIDRYIAWPAQSLGYKIGQLKFRELRESARQQLGTHFDIRTFHDEVLSGGNLPLDVLESRVNTWLATQLPPNSTTHQN